MRPPGDLDDVTHLTTAQKDALWGRESPATSATRAPKGNPDPRFGQGVNGGEETIICEPFDVTRSFARLTGVDLASSIRSRPRGAAPGDRGQTMFL